MLSGVCWRLYYIFEVIKKRIEDGDATLIKSFYVRCRTLRFISCSLPYIRVALLYFDDGSTYTSIICWREAVMDTAVNL